MGVAHDRDAQHVAWVRSFVALLDKLAAYVKAHHTTGLAWNKGGVPLEEYDGASGAAEALGAPPAPPAPPASGAADTGASSGGGMDAVFGQINQGASITRSLRHVDASQQTHKNPALRHHDAAPATPASAASAGATPQAKRKPPAKTLDGNKWTIVRSR